MARIRSIYPGTPIDPEFALIPVEGRLLFIYSWTTADDAGNFERNPLGLRMGLFPGDEWATVQRITELVEALIAGRFYEPYEVDGKQFLHVRNFAKYQKPDHPTAPRFPLQPGQQYTYHVRQGNGWGTKTEQGPLPEPPPNVPRKNRERSRRIGSGSGSGSGLEGIGKERNRKGGDRGGKPTEQNGNDDSAPLGGQSPPIDKGNGNGTAKTSGKITPIKEVALEEVARKVRSGEIDLVAASEQLRTFGFSHSEINSPALIELLRRAAN